MNKICTSIEQSKKLVELGIDINTADMFYSSWTILADGEYILSPLNGETLTNLQRQYGNQIIPAWSLSALLELMDVNDCKMTLKYGDCSEYTMCFDDDYTFNSITKDGALDAAFEMICWLKQKRKI